MIPEEIKLLVTTRAVIKAVIATMGKEELLAFKAHYQELLNATIEALDKLEGVKWS